MLLVVVFFLIGLDRLDPELFFISGAKNDFSEGSQEIASGLPVLNCSSLFAFSAGLSDSSDALVFLASLGELGVISGLTPLLTAQEQSVMSPTNKGARTVRVNLKNTFPDGVYFEQFSTEA